MPKPVLIHVVNGELNAYITASSLEVWEAIGWTVAETGDSGPVETPVAENSPAETPETEEPMISTEGDVRYVPSNPE